MRSHTYYAETKLKAPLWRNFVARTAESCQGKNCRKYQYKIWMRIWRTFALAGTILLENGTVSFSLLIMPTISCSSVNSSLAMPSKHFFKWGWTRNGSLVSDRISSSSSLDRKKNLEKTKATVTHTWWANWESFMITKMISKCKVDG